MVFMDLEPFGDDREDIRSGLIIQTLLNIFRDRKRKPVAFKLADCVVPGGDQFKRATLDSGQEGPAPKQQQQPWMQMKFAAMLYCSQYMAGKES